MSGRNHGSASGPSRPDRIVSTGLFDEQAMARIASRPVVQPKADAAPVRGSDGRLSLADRVLAWFVGRDGRADS
ncbi:hypothetical protein BW14_08700 [Bifidobacterium sp. UTBIF-68]|uniref:hypothetical protein n=1 Tax=Bifidobacterium sp. UTBIF-68 TaxID=1465262 RepID=UPI001125EF00|nr:hypothetical protein [Bifidobacterium sp. UTBIF-68]TPF92490.1 hypothetical protein BW14_08700 [Bifidobacterium sp. UTBIF-68]